MTHYNSWNNDTSVDETIRSINNTCKSRGGIYRNYNCKFVSWDDSSRSSGFGGIISSWGSNITDTYLKAKDGRKLFTVRPDNWNEKLGTVSASGLAVVAGNHRHGGFGEPNLQPITLGDLLKNMGEYGKYAGLNQSCNLSNDHLDREVSIRFQTTFLPIPKNSSPFGNGERETIEFATEAFNYQTRTEDNPKNIILLCTTQGLAVQQDGSKKTQLYHHSIDKDNRIHRHWLEAERTAHSVGVHQKESEQEKADALARGKATATVIGPRALGTRFNCLMTVQIPLKQKPTAVTGGLIFGVPAPALSPFGVATGYGADLAAAPAPASALFGAIAPISDGGTVSNPSRPFGAPPAPTHVEGGLFGAPASVPVTSGIFGATAPAPVIGGFFGATAPATSGLFGSTLPASASIGRSSAARVSRGTEHDILSGGSILKAKSFIRHESERITATICIYNVVVGGVPTEADVVAAIDDLEQLYAACCSVPRQDTHQFNNSVTTTTTTPTTVINGGIFPEPQPPKLSPQLNGDTRLFSPFSDMLKTTLNMASNLPMNMETYMYLHETGLQRLNDTNADQNKLFDAFGFFRLTNDISIQQQGAPDGSSLYNMACCCSRLAVHTLIHKEKTCTLPTWTSMTDACLNASVSWLFGSVGAGYKNYKHMMVDPDLEAVRSQRPTQFGLVVSNAQNL